MHDVKTPYDQFAAMQARCLDLSDPQARKVMENLVCKMLRYGSKFPEPEIICKTMHGLGLSLDGEDEEINTVLNASELFMYMGMMQGLGILYQVLQAKERM